MFSVPKKIVAPKIRSKAPTSRLYSFPPFCIPKVSSISLLLNSECRQVNRHQPILTERQSELGVTGNLKNKAPVPPLEKQFARLRYPHGQAAQNEGARAER